jgi:hypothetical protein
LADLNQMAIRVMHIAAERRATSRLSELGLNGYCSTSLLAGESVIEVLRRFWAILGEGGSGRSVGANAILVSGLDGMLGG